MHSTANNSTPRARVSTDDLPSSEEWKPAVVSLFYRINRPSSSNGGHGKKHRRIPREKHRPDVLEDPSLPGSGRQLMGGTSGHAGRVLTVKYSVARESDSKEQPSSHHGGLAKTPSLPKQGHSTTPAVPDTANQVPEQQISAGPPRPSSWSAVITNSQRSSRGGGGATWLLAPGPWPMVLWPWPMALVHIPAGCDS